MKLPLRLLPIFLFFIFYGLIQGSFRSLRILQEREDERQSKIIQEIVVNRFQQYLELPLMISKLGAQFVGSGDIMKAPYEIYTDNIRKANPEFLGFNIVDSKGLIIRTAPEDENAKARGRVSQMYGALLESYRNHEPHYVSSPFRLYQGQQGFIVYSPMVSNDKLKGWYAIVIASEVFLKRFRLEDFLKLYDLVILDDSSRQDYFSTAVTPIDGTRVYTSAAKILGRKIHFKTWRKVEAQTYSFPWFFSVIFSLILSLGSAFMLKLYVQKKKAKDQLRNMSILLRVTSKEALSNLIDIHSEFNRLNLPEDDKTQRLSRDINYLTNLIEQIDLLQTMAQNRESISNESQSLGALIQGQLDNFGEVLERKKIRVKFSSDEFHTVALKINIWLFENSVLSNVFSHLLIYIQENSTLEISAEGRGSQEIIVFRMTREKGSEPSRVLTRRLEVARKVLELHEGNLKEEKDNDHLIIRLIIPR